MGLKFRAAPQAGGNAKIDIEMLKIEHFQDESLQGRGDLETSSQSTINTKIVSRIPMISLACLKFGD